MLKRPSDSEGLFFRARARLGITLRRINARLPGRRGVCARQSLLYRPGARNLRRTENTVLLALSELAPPAADTEDGPKGFGAHSDQERILEAELYRFVQFFWDPVLDLARATR